MTKHMCHWSRKDARKIAEELYNSDVHIEHIIWLDVLTHDRRMFSDPLEEFFDGAELPELQAVFGDEAGALLYDCHGHGMDTSLESLQHIGGWLVLGYFSPPESDGVRFNEKGEAIGYGIAPYQAPCRGWSLNLHTAVGKCLGYATGETRKILNRAKEVWQRQQETSHAPV